MEFSSNLQGARRAAADEGDMRPFHCVDKLDNME
jgi:hypothetical protein